jgi:hypothetical protein
MGCAKALESMLKTSMNDAKRVVAFMLNRLRRRVRTSASMIGVLW